MKAITRALLLLLATLGAQGVDDVRVRDAILEETFAGWERGRRAYWLPMGGKATDLDAVFRAWEAEVSRARAAS